MPTALFTSTNNAMPHRQIVRAENSKTHSMESSPPGYDEYRIRFLLNEWAVWYAYRNKAPELSYAVTQSDPDAWRGKNHMDNSREHLDEMIMNYQEQVDDAISQLPALNRSALRVWAHLQRLNKRHKVMRSNRLTEAEISQLLDESIPLLVPMLVKLGVPI